MSTPAFYWGTGRRKTAVARVRLIPGEGQMVINGRTPEEHFGGILGEAELFLPFRVTGTEGRYNTMIKVARPASPAPSATASPVPSSSPTRRAIGCRCARPASSPATRG